MASPSVLKPYGAIVRAVNPNYRRAGEPLSAFDARQVQVGLRLKF